MWRLCLRPGSIPFSLGSALNGHLHTAAHVSVTAFVHVVERKQRVWSEVPAECVIELNLPVRGRFRECLELVDCRWSGGS